MTQRLIPGIGWVDIPTQRGDVTPDPKNPPRLGPVEEGPGMTTEIMPPSLRGQTAIGVLNPATGAYDRAASEAANRNGGRLPSGWWGNPGGPGPGYGPKEGQPRLGPAFGPAPGNLPPGGRYSEDGNWYYPPMPPSRPGEYQAQVMPQPIWVGEGPAPEMGFGGGSGEWKQDPPRLGPVEAGPEMPWQIAPVDKEPPTKIPSTQILELIRALAGM